MYRMKVLIVDLVHANDEFFGPDDEAWDLETGKPGIGLFAKAIQVWAVCQLEKRPRVTVQQAAMAFRVKTGMVKTAVEWHPYMYLNDDLIEHEGE